MASDPGRFLRRLAGLCLAAAAAAALALAPLALAALAVAAPSATAQTTGGGPALAVDAAGTDHHPISPDIYGLNFADATIGRATSLPVDRWGGDGTETYNYRLGSSNTAFDYYFENVADCFAQAYNWCSGLTRNNVFGYRNFVVKDRQLGAKTLITLPMAGYVAKVAPVGHPLTCGYPKTIWPTQDSFDPYDPNCGNGRSGGATITGNPTLDGLAIGPGWYGAWIGDLKRRYGPASSGGVAFYELGNEPSLWGATHSDIHPAAENARELWSKAWTLARAVKAADPSAQVLGLSEWGWPGYFCTEADTYGNGCGSTGCTTSPDCANHSHLPIAEWLLRQFSINDTKTGIRHLDYLDVHYYAQGGNSPDVTRSLWDPTYVDPSWINSRIGLIPRIKCWIEGHIPNLCPGSPGYYPGTKIALSEYNLSLSNIDPVTNAIIQADTLGIFAREGVDLATRWPMGYDGNLIPYAFEIYRNYDGAHSTFGDVWIHSTSANQSQLAVYGARRTSDGAYTILVLNKTGSSLGGPLTLTGISSAGPAQTWRWTGGAIGQLTGGTPIKAGVITATYPGKSMTPYVIK